jgi:hypothetical protein
MDLEEGNCSTDSQKRIQKLNLALFLQYSIWFFSASHIDVNENCNVSRKTYPASSVSDDVD